VSHLIDILAYTQSHISGPCFATTGRHLYPFLVIKDRQFSSSTHAHSHTGRILIQKPADTLLILLMFMQEKNMNARSSCRWTHDEYECKYERLCHLRSLLTNISSYSSDLNTILISMLYICRVWIFPILVYVLVRCTDFCVRIQMKAKWHCYTCFDYLCCVCFQLSVVWTVVCKTWKLN